VPEGLTGQFTAKVAFDPGFQTEWKETTFTVE
jgi:hypothetical protein